MAGRVAKTFADKTSRAAPGGAWTQDDSFGGRTGKGTRPALPPSSKAIISSAMLAPELNPIARNWGI